MRTLHELLEALAPATVDKKEFIVEIEVGDAGNRCVVCGHKVEAHQQLDEHNRIPANAQFKSHTFKTNLRHTIQEVRCEDEQHIIVLKADTSGI